MKVPVAKQLPSGNWFVRIRIDGKDIGITRPTEKEAIAEAMALKAGVKNERDKAPKDLTLRQAIDQYIELRSAALSPSTIRGYTMIRDHRFPELMDRTIRATTDLMYQRAVNAAAKQYSAKTVRNTWAFIASVLREVADREVKCVTPTVVVQERPFLEPEEIPLFVEELRGRPVEIPALLALHGLRASEVMDVRWSDIDLAKKMIRVHGAAVRDKDNNLVHKQTNKNAASRREVPILIDRLIAAVAEADKPGEYVCSVKGTGLYNAINLVCKHAGLPQVGVHGLRHSFASLCYHLNLPEQLCMRLGGWSDAGTMRKIYTHLAQRDIHKHTAALVDFFNK